MPKPYIEIKNATDPNRCNCVKYVRARVPKLPYGLWTIGDKKKIINEHYPMKGCVAIMNIGYPWGHVGIITHVGRNHLTIKEANYKSCKVTYRHNSAIAMKVLGYFNPEKV